MMLAEGCSLQMKARHGWGSAPGESGLPSWAGRRGRGERKGEGWGAFGAEFSRVRGKSPPRFFQLRASAPASRAPTGVEIQVHTVGRRGIPNAKERTEKMERVGTSYLPSVTGKKGKNVTGLRVSNILRIYIKAAVKRTFEAEANQRTAPGISSRSAARIHCT